MADAGWMEMLRSAVERAPTLQSVADQLEVSHTMISLVLNGKYGTRSTANLEARVLTRLDFVACPHIHEELRRAQCDEHRKRDMPRSHPDKLRHWLACQRCEIHKAGLADAALVRRSA